jgi:hypothetical protein
MLYQVFDPPANLAPYVRFFWALEVDVAPGEVFVHRSMADGCVEMVFHYRSAFDEITPDELIESSPLASIQAQSTRFRRFVTGKRLRHLRRLSLSLCDPAALRISRIRFHQHLTRSHIGLWP